MPSGAESDHVLARKSLDTIELSLQQCGMRSDNPRHRFVFSRGSAAQNRTRIHRCSRICSIQEPQRLTAIGSRAANYSIKSTYISKFSTEFNRCFDPARDQGCGRRSARGYVMKCRQVLTNEFASLGQKSAPRLRAPETFGDLPIRVVNDKGDLHQRSQDSFLRRIELRVGTAHLLFGAVVDEKTRDTPIAREAGDSVHYRSLLKFGPQHVCESLVREAGNTTGTEEVLHSTGSLSVFSGEAKFKCSSFAIQTLRAIPTPS